MTFPTIGRDNWREFAAPRVDRDKWTAVVPAAGLGSRLGSRRPKLLYPVAGRPILDWLLDLLLPHCSSFVFVLSPAGTADVAGELALRTSVRYSIVTQDAPTGMGDAVALAVPEVRTPQVAVVWGDQVALQRESVEGCLRLQQGPLAPDLTCPTVLRDRPYVHFDRDADGSLVAVRQAREGDLMPAWGESDTGFFCFRTVVLAHLLRALRAAPEAIGRRTGEFNLLPLIPHAARPGRVLTPRLMSVEETVGVNTPEDAAAVATFLRPHTTRPLIV